VTKTNAACMIVSEQAFVMLLIEPFFKTFTQNEICNTTKQTEGLFALSCSSRAEVDELVEKAVAAAASMRCAAGPRLSCTAGASTIRTATTGSHCGSTRRRSSRCSTSGTFRRTNGQDEPGGCAVRRASRRRPVDHEHIHFIGETAPPAPPGAPAESSAAAATANE